MEQKTSAGRLGTCALGAAMVLMVAGPCRADTDASQKDTAPVVGFGRNVVISTALHDVVPPGTTVTFGPGVPNRTPVTWNGGEPWRKTVASIAAQAGVEAMIDGRTVTISNRCLPAAPRVAAPRRPRIAHAQPKTIRPTAQASLGRGRVASPSLPGDGTRFDSPTVDQMSLAEATLATPLPMGQPVRFVRRAP